MQYMGMNRWVFISPYDNYPAFARKELSHGVIVEQLFLYWQPHWKRKRKHHCGSQTICLPCTWEGLQTMS